MSPGGQYPLRTGAAEDPPSGLRLWSASHKVDGRYLPAWLEELDGGTPATTAFDEEDIEVEVPLPSAYEIRQAALGLDPYSPLHAW